MFKVHFDKAELRRWLLDHANLALDGFLDAVDDDFFGDQIRSTNVADIQLPEDERRPFLPFARKWVYREDRRGDAPVAPATVADDALADHEMFDTIALPGLLQRVRDPFHLLRTAYGRLRTGGTLIVSVPSRELFERKYREPSARDPERNKRLYTASRVLLEVQAALGFNAYRLRFAKEFDGLPSSGGIGARVPPETGPFSLIMVFEKREGWTFYPDVDRISVDRSFEVKARGEEEGVLAIGTSAILRPALDPAAVERVCVIKADHIGDFVMAVPVFAEIREMFPTAEIVGVCGSWNVALAGDLGFFDRVVACDYFKQDERHGGLSEEGKAHAVQQFGDELRDEQFDLAIDLRVPQDSRALLLAVRARYRAGIGSVADVPFLDVALPQLDAFTLGLDADREVEEIFVSPTRFAGRGIVAATPSLTILKPKASDGEFIFGPYMALRRGAYRLSFLLSTLDPPSDAVPAPPGPGVTVQVRAEVAVREMRQRTAILTVTPTGAHATIDFELHADSEKIEFRLVLEPGQADATLLFAGVTLQGQSGRRPIRHMAPGQIHMKEQMSLLLALVRTRLFDRAADPATMRRRLRVPAPVPAAAPFFALVPFSNSALRDWPLDGYVALSRLLLEQTGAAVHLIGAPSHHDQLETLRIGLPDGLTDRIVNHAGRPWLDVYADLADAEAVVTNNSGIAHVAGLLGARVLALYSASHQVLEWGPLGSSVTTLQARLPCGQCGFDTVGECLHGLRCTHLITPATVIGELRRIAPRSFAGGDDPAKPPVALAMPKLTRSGG